MSKMGRPSKYEEAVTTQKVYALVEAMTAEKFFDFCSIDHIAYALSVHKDTIYEWAKKYDDFSEAIKAFETKRNMLFYRFVISSQIQPAKWIFLAKNWLGLRDDQHVQHSGEVTHTMTLEDFRDSEEKYDQERGEEFSIN